VALFATNSSPAKVLRKPWAIWALSGKHSNETRLARWHFLLSPRKKGAREFFSRFQEAAIKLFTFSAVWRDKCTLNEAVVTFDS
jgi:hypothetical protein